MEWFNTGPQRGGIFALEFLSNRPSVLLAGGRGDGLDVVDLRSNQQPSIVGDFFVLMQYYSPIFFIPFFSFKNIYMFFFFL